MLSETKIIDQIFVGQDDVVHIREASLVFRDSVEISRTYHRTTLIKNQEVSVWPQKVQDICAAAWRY